MGSLFYFVDLYVILSITIILLVFNIIALKWVLELETELSNIDLLHKIIVSIQSPLNSHMEFRMEIFFPEQLALEIG